MDEDINDNEEIETFYVNGPYTPEEKKIIMDRLNKERLIHQKIVEELNPTTKIYDEDEKKLVLQKLNEKRLSTQKRELILKSRNHNKQIYKFGSKEFYKFKNMEREYYIEISDVEKILSRPTILPLYYRTFEELNKKDFLMKTEVYSEMIFISSDRIRVYFKGYLLEDAYK